MEQIDRDVWSIILPHMALSQIVKLGMVSKTVSVQLHDLSFAVTKLDLSPYSRNLTDEACEKMMTRFGTWQKVTKLNVSHCTNLSGGTLSRLVLAVAEKHVLRASLPFVVELKMSGLLYDVLVGRSMDEFSPETLAPASLLKTVCEKCCNLKRLYVKNVELSPLIVDKLRLIEQAVFVDRLEELQIGRKSVSCLDGNFSLLSFVQRHSNLGQAAHMWRTMADSRTWDMEGGILPPLTSVTANDLIFSTIFRHKPSIQVLYTLMDIRETREHSELELQLQSVPRKIRPTSEELFARRLVAFKAKPYSESVSFKLLKSLRDMQYDSPMFGNTSDEAIELLHSALPATDFTRPGLLNASDFVVQQLAVAYLRAGHPEQALATVNQYYDVIAAAPFHFNINEYFVESPSSTSASAWIGMLAARLVGTADETHKWAQLLLAQMEKDECGSSTTFVQIDDFMHNTKSCAYENSAMSPSTPYILYNCFPDGLDGGSVNACVGCALYGPFKDCKNKFPAGAKLHVGCVSSAIDDDEFVPTIDPYEGFE